MDAPKFTDFLVTSQIPERRLDPDVLDQTINSFGAALIRLPGEDYVQVDGCYVMRVFGDPSFIKFACEKQGYCHIVGERGAPEQMTAEVSAAVDTIEYTYTNVAEAFASRVNEVFMSEDTLKTCFESHFKGLEFSRTERWSSILFKEMDTVWREQGPDKLASLTSHDRFSILGALSDYLDFNLYSQVALNLQNWGLVAYQSGGDVEGQLDKIKQKWEKFSSTPLTAGAKMVKDAFRPQDIEWNKDLSTVKSLKTIAVIVTPNISFRVSPKGSTPAFADSQNFSTIGIGGDDYVKPQPGYTVWYVAWKPGSTPYILAQQADGGFMTPGISYTFHSKSGGTILNEVLFARGIAFAFWTGLGMDTLCMPRMNSVMVVSSQPEDVVREIFSSLGQPMLELFRDKR